MDKQSPNKKSATELRQEYDQKIRQLAIQTYRWAIKQGCVREAADEEVQGYFTVAKPSKNTGKPYWCAAFPNENASVWPDVYMEMLRVGFPICADPFNGHYIGVDGEQATKLLTTINNVKTRAESGRKMTELLIEARVWGESSEYLKNHLPKELQAIDPMIILNTFEQLLLGMGIPQQKTLAQYLLDNPQSPQD